jgi:hypothetical protein
MKCNKILLMAALGLTMSALGALSAKGADGDNLKRTPTPPSYTLTEIAPGKGFAGAYMNNFGEIAGYIPAPSPAYNHAAIYVGGKIVDLGAQLNPAIPSQATFINLRGEVLLITTTSITGGTFDTGYTYKKGRFTPVKLPTGASMPWFSGLNDFGFAVGAFLDPTATNTPPVSGFLLGPDGAFVKLPIVPTAYFCINDVGQILGDNRTGGFVPTLREPGGRLIPLPFDSAAALNQLGHVCGRDGPATNVFLYAKGQVTNLGFLPGHPPHPYDGQSTEYTPTSLNDCDTVIGMVDSNIGEVFETGWLYTNGQMYDLAQCITPQAGFIIVGVSNILDDGRILAVGSSSSVFGPYQTVVLTPKSKKFMRP